MSRLSLGQKIALGAAAPVAAYGVFKGTMQAITDLYSMKVWATPEEEVAPMPGDDLVIDPYGQDTMTVTQAKDLDAPVEEVWKHIYQMGIEKAGYYSWVNFERLFGMIVNNYYGLQEMWQGENEKKPGDFWSWGLMGYGAEVCDLVPNKYVVWGCDSRRPAKAPGATAILLPGMDYLIWNWCIALKPLDDGNRCRIYSRYILAYGPHNPINTNILKLVIVQGGMMMTRRMFENLEKAARFERKKSGPMRFWELAMGRAHAAPDDLHERTPYPEVRFSRDFPWIEDLRAPITDDPNWPPATPGEYKPPIEENNAKCGWTPEKAAENAAKCEARYEELRKQMGLK